MKKMNLATMCSGVGAPEKAMEDFANAMWCSEIDKFPAKVLDKRFPQTPNLGDMLKIRSHNIYKNTHIDLAVAGTPCQGFSVAGHRGGLEDDPRARLSLEFVEILREKQPRWFIWENVPGVLSSGQGGDFKRIIEAFTQCGYGICWRVLDAQHFGVPQRRRRVFVVGYLGDWRPSYRVLFESESLRGNIKKSKCEKEDIARKTEGSTGKTVSGKEEFPTLTAAQGSKQWLGNQEAFSGDYFISQSVDVVHGTQDPIASKNKAFCIGRNNGQENALMVHENQRSEITLNNKTGALKGQGGKPGQGYPCLFRYSKSHRPTHIDQRINSDGTTNALNTGDGCSNQSTQNIVYCGTQNDYCRDATKELSPTLRAGNNGGAINQIVSTATVRKLTPLECERLQGFPDNWTRINYNGKGEENCPKGHRYKAMGNSMAVPVLKWIGERIYTIHNYIEMTNEKE